jgi:hypothetical protein
MLFSCDASDQEVTLAPSCGASVASSCDPGAVCDAAMSGRNRLTLSEKAAPLLLRGRWLCSCLLSPNRRFGRRRHVPPEYAGVSAACP